MFIQRLLPLQKTHIFGMQGCEICDNLLGMQNLDQLHTTNPVQLACSILCRV